MIYYTYIYTHTQGFFRRKKSRYAGWLLNRAELDIPFATIMVF